MVTIHLLTTHSASAAVSALPPSLNLVSHLGVTMAATQAALVAVGAVAGPPVRHPEARPH